MSIRCLKSEIQCLNAVVGCTRGCEYCYARTVARRYHVTEDFSIPQFFPTKLRILDRKRPRIYFMTGMSDLSDWKREWIDTTMDAVGNNPQHQYIFLTKSPDRLRIRCDMNNVCFGVTITRDSEKGRIRELRRNVRAGSYHITFEPMFDRISDIDFEGVDWIVLGTETGNRRGKAVSQRDWIQDIADSAIESGVSVFMKEDVKDIMDEENMIQELPRAYEELLVRQKEWRL